MSAMPDGFHMRAEGEEIILDVTDDARFALDLGLRNAPPLLRHRMSALLRTDSSTAEPPPSWRGSAICTALRAAPLRADCRRPPRG